MMNKIIQTITILIVLDVLLSGCTPTVLTIQSAFISPIQSDIGYVEKISPDGSSLIWNNLLFIELETNKGTSPFSFANDQDWVSDYFIDNFIIMPKSDVIIAETHGIKPENQYETAVYILDNHQKTISAPLELYTVTNPSPFGNRFLAMSYQPLSMKFHVYDLITNTKIPLTETNTDYTKVQVKASDIYLWSNKTNLPVGSLILINPIDFGGNIAPQIVGINPVIGDAEGDITSDYTAFNQIYQSNPPNNMIHAQFSPDGNYILATQWICAPSDPKQCSNYELGNDDQRYDGSVTDTALILINWRTGEVKELIRLSQVDPSNVIGLSTEWSADGSTILVWRKEASPVVIKLK